MSSIYQCEKCNKEYVFWNGIGFAYPTKYMEVVEGIRSGKMGDELKQLLLDNPKGVFDISKHVYYCSKCHAWYEDMSLDFYLPKESHEDEETLVAPWDLDHDRYRLVRKNRHICKKCGNKRTRCLTLDPCGPFSKETSLSGIDLRCSCGGRIRKTQNAIFID